MSSVLHVELEVKEGSAEALVDTYRSTFRPAISKQDGFQVVRLLRPVDAPAFRLVIEFSQEEQRRRWVETDVHQEVWPQIEALCHEYRPNLFQDIDG